MRQYLNITISEIVFREFNLSKQSPRNVFRDKGLLSNLQPSQFCERESKRGVLRKGLLVVQLMPKCDIRRHTLTHCLAGPRVGRSGLLTLQQLISVRISKTPTQLMFKPIHKQGLLSTLIALFEHI